LPAITRPNEKISDEAANAPIAGSGAQHLLPARPGARVARRHFAFDVTHSVCSGVWMDVKVWLDLDRLRFEHRVIDAEIDS